MERVMHSFLDRIYFFRELRIEEKPAYLCVAFCPHCSRHIHDGCILCIQLHLGTFVFKAIPGFHFVISFLLFLAKKKREKERKGKRERSEEF
jgi:hypothetical protein